MARPSKEEMAAISSLMAARALTRAAGPEPDIRAQLVSALHGWTPELDIVTRRELAAGVSADFLTIANAVDARLLRLIDKGAAILPTSVDRASLERAVIRAAPVG
jgi:hypothetical protein